MWKYIALWTLSLMMSTVVSAQSTDNPGVLDDSKLRQLEGQDIDPNEALLQISKTGV
jgi:hypothetical protein